MTFAAKDIFRALALCPCFDISNAQGQSRSQKNRWEQKLSCRLPSRPTRHDRPDHHRRRATIAFVPPLAARRRRPNPVQNRLSIPGPIVADECGSHSLPWFTLPMAPTSRLGSAHLRRCNCDCRRSNFVPAKIRHSKLHIRTSSCRSPASHRAQSARFPLPESKG